MDAEAVADMATPLMPARESTLGFHPWIALPSAPASQFKAESTGISNKKDMQANALIEGARTASSTIR